MLVQRYGNSEEKRKCVLVFKYLNKFTVYLYNLMCASDPLIFTGNVLAA